MIQGDKAVATNPNLDIFEEGNKYLMATYDRLPVVFMKAKMNYLWDASNERYLDFIAGYGCLNVGHSNPYVVKKLKKQIEKIIQPSNVYYNQPQVELAKKLCEITGFGEKVFFANSGTEAIEGAIKLARKYSVEKYHSSRYEIISFFKSFHGRTYGALSATAQPEKQKVYQPLVGGFRYANLNDIDSVEKNVNDNTCAILIEPVQGEGGINVSEKDFLKKLREICSKNDILLILDEIQTGFGRTGSMFAYQNYGIYPDILVLAKSLGGGMPIGVVISTNEISSFFSPGSHGSTFGGNAASCTAGCAVIEYLVKNNLSQRAKVLGDYFMNKLKELSGKYSLIKEVRGMGLMIGMELNEPVADKLVGKALNDHLVLNKVSPYTLRFLPPLVISKRDIDILIRWLDRNLKDF